MTSFYMFRLWFKTFFGPQHFDEHTDHDAHASTTTPTAWKPRARLRPGRPPPRRPRIPLDHARPLVILAILSSSAAGSASPQALGGHNEIEHFLDPVFAATASIAREAVNPTRSATRSRLGLAAVSVLTALARPLHRLHLLLQAQARTAAAIAARFPAVYNLVANKFYIDEIYDFAHRHPAPSLTRGFLDLVVDSGGIVNGSGKLAGLATTSGSAALTRRMQSGNIRSYAGWLALGAAAVITVMIFGRFWIR